MEGAADPVKRAAQARRCSIASGEASSNAV
jgi:hypothetical protein